jgi:hypothetical protein
MIDSKVGHLFIYKVAGSFLGKEEPHTPESGIRSDIIAGRHQ